jgi:hypothetical protein
MGTLFENVKVCRCIPSTGNKRNIPQSQITMILVPGLHLNKYFRNTHNHLS